MSGTFLRSVHQTRTHPSEEIRSQWEGGGAELQRHQKGQHRLPYVLLQWVTTTVFVYLQSSVNLIVLVRTAYHIRNNKLSHCGENHFIFRHLFKWNWLKHAFFLFVGAEVEAKGESDRLTEDQLSQMINKTELVKITDQLRPAGSWAFWYPESEMDKTELETGQEVRLKTRGNSPFICQWALII